LISTLSIEIGRDILFFASSLFVIHKNLEIFPEK